MKDKLHIGKDKDDVGASTYNDGTTGTTTGQGNLPLPPFGILRNSNSKQPSIPCLVKLDKVRNSLIFLMQAQPLLATLPEPPPVTLQPEPQPATRPLLATAAPLPATATLLQETPAPWEAPGPRPSNL